MPCLYPGLQSSSPAVFHGLSPHQLGLVRLCCSSKCTLESQAISTVTQGPRLLSAAGSTPCHVTPHQQQGGREGWGPGGCFLDKVWGRLRTLVPTPRRLEIHPVAPAFEVQSSCVSWEGTEFAEHLQSCHFPLPLCCPVHSPFSN